VESNTDFLLASGRAVVFPVYKGTYERRDGLSPNGTNPPAFRRDHQIAWAKDLGRTLDYLETRPDFDITRVGYIGYSSGGTEGARSTVRFKLLIASCMRPARSWASPITNQIR
jgi:dienelactone hydrolase